MRPTVVTAEKKEKKKKRKKKEKKQVELSGPPRFFEVGTDLTKAE